MQIQIMEQEYWWAGIVEDGAKMPFSVDSVATVDFYNIETSNQVEPLLLSSKGRYLKSDKPFKAQFINGEIKIDQEIPLKEGYENLKGAYLAAMKKYFSEDAAKLDADFFTLPQYNTWIELMYNQTQEGIMSYAKGILEHELPPGILMIDEGWAEDYGRFDFRKGAFPDPQKMIEELHEMGFRIMLWITPYISPDSAAFREIHSKGYLLKDHTGEVAIRKWWNGYSAVLDLTNPSTVEWFYAKLNSIMTTYRVDGFKFDGGDPYMYRDDDQAFQTVSAFDHTRIYGEFGLKFPLNEFRAGYRLGGQPLVMRLADKSHNWTGNGLNMLIPNSLIQGLTGCVYHCPDMIGGGEYSSFLDESKLDQELVVRYAQAAALCPMMQFSVAPWRILSKENCKLVIQAAELHQQFGAYIQDMSEYAYHTGEPIMRHMEYEFPKEGFEKILDQFMLGDKYLVAPVILKGQRERTVKLPAGQWKDEQGKLYEGGQIIRIEAELSRLPWFEKI